MTNFEKHKDEILRIATESDSNPAKKDGVVVACAGLDCEYCDFNDMGKCRKNCFEWLYEDDGDDGEEHDGCDGCKYEYKREDESPCAECCNNYTSKWERRPKKTRQQKFKKLFPNVATAVYAIDIKPCIIDTTLKYDGCKTQGCGNCRRAYWQEVEDKC